MVKYKNPKLTLLDLTMAIFSFWGAKKAFDRAPIIEDKAAKAAETAKSTTDSSTENTNNVKIIQVITIQVIQAILKNLTLQKVDEVKII